jgi:nicotinamide riboside kinase
MARLGEARAMIIAIVGAESTGKTVLAAALADRLAAETRLACVAVPEWLRLWCEREQRVPRQDEQRAIAEQAWVHIEDAQRAHDVVIADTTPLMIAVYSLLLFGDDSVVSFAVDCQRRCAATLLTAVDLPWVADGLFRDGPQVQGPVNAITRRLLDEHGLAYSIVAGAGPARLEHALDAVTPLFGQDKTPRRGLFTRLAERDARQPTWVCRECDVPECEHALKRATSRARSP